MPEVNIPGPLGGRDDSVMSIGQSVNTTSEAFNVRGRAPNGRQMIARRPGMVDFLQVGVGTNPRGAASVVFENRRIEASAADDPIEVYGEPSKASGDAFAVRFDSLGNSYTLDGGTTIVIRNSKGEEQKRIAIPTLSSGATYRALAVNPETGLVFVGVSAGGEQIDAAILAFVEHPFRGFEVLYVFGTSEYVEKLAFRGDELVALQNDTATGRAYVVAYQNTTVGPPSERWRSQVPYPGNTLAVDSVSGKVTCGSGINADRGLDPGASGAGQVLDRSFESWDFDKLNDGTRWAEFDPEDLDLDDGDAVELVEDKNGSARKLTGSSDAVAIPELMVRFGGNAEVFAADSTVTFETLDGSESFTYRYHATLAQAGDILHDPLIANNLNNLADVINNGGDGVISHEDTDVNPFVAAPAGLGSIKIRPRAGFKAIKVTCSAGTKIRVRTDGSGSAFLTESVTFAARNVTCTAPTLRARGLGGRPTLAFDGVSNRLQSDVNPDVKVSSSGQHTTFFPGFGSGTSLSASAKFSAFIVFAPKESQRPCTLISQATRVTGGATYHRRVEIGKYDAGVMDQDRVSVFEKPDGSAIERHEFDVESDFVLGYSVIGWISNPTGNYEIWRNGFPVGSTTGSFTVATYDSATRTLTEAGLGTAAAGASHIVVVSGTGATLGVYTIASITAPDDVELVEALAVGDLITGDIAGTWHISADVAGANDSLGRTFVGQSPNIPDAPEFFEGEIAYMMCRQAAVTSAERQLIEARLTWRFGAAQLLPDNHPYKTIPPDFDGTTSRFHLARKALSLFPTQTTLDAKTQDIAWMIASDGTATNPIGGIGYGCEWNSEGHLYTVGVPMVPGTDNASVRKIIDLGTDYTLDWSDALGPETFDRFTFDRMDLGVDQFDNLFVPWNADRFSGAPLKFIGYRSDGTRFLEPESDTNSPGLSIAIAPNLDEIDLDAVNVTNQVVVGARTDFRSLMEMLALPIDGDTFTVVGTTGGSASIETYVFKNTLSGGGIDIKIGTSIEETIENVKAALNHEAGEGTLYDTGMIRSRLVTAIDLKSNTLALLGAEADQSAPVATASTTGITFTPETFVKSGDNVKGYDLINAELTGDAGRERVQIITSGTDVWKFGDDYAQIVTGGTGVISAASRYSQSVAHFTRIITTDGVNSFVYDTLTGILTPYTATDGGAVPKAFQLIEMYGARVICAGIGGRPYSIVGSRVGEPFDFNKSPAVIDGLQAFDTEASVAGNAPFLVNGFAPIGDDLAIVFCDNAIYQLTGDPAPGSNGRFDEITRSVGGAFGRAWCHGPNGALFFWAAHGEPMVMAVGSEPQPLIGKKFLKTFEEIDLSRSYIRLAWDNRRDGLNIISCPFGGETVASRAFFWERWSGAIWEDTCTRNITDMLEIDGDDADDRRVLFLGADGMPRSHDDLAEDDAGEPFEGRVMVGPIAFKDQRLQTKLSRLQVILDSQSADCFVEIWVSDAPSKKDRFAQRFTLRPGVSATLPARVRGNYLWFVVRGKGRWAYEMASALIDPGGVRRPTLVP